MGAYPKICLVLAMLSSACMTVALRLFQNSDNNRYGMILGNYITCMVTGFFFVPEKAMILSAHPLTYVCGIAGGVFFVLSLLCMQRSIYTNGAILTSAFAKLGLIVPLVFSILFFHETPDLLQTAGLVIALVAVWVFSKAKDEESQKNGFSLWMLVIVLLANGLADAMAKIYSFTGLVNEEAVYIFILFLCAALITSFLYVYETKQTRSNNTLRGLLAGIAVGIPNYFSSYLLLKALGGIEAFIVYPLFSLGAIVIVTLISFVFFHETLNRRQVIGLGMILLCIGLLNLS